MLTETQRRRCRQVADWLDLCAGYTEDAGEQYDHTEDAAAIRAALDELEAQAEELALLRRVANGQDEGRILDAAQDALEEWRAKYAKEAPPC